MRVSKIMVRKQMNYLVSSSNPIAGDDEEEDDNIPLESDDHDDLTEDDDEQMVDVDEEKPKLIVKLPVKTPTPERKTIIKLHLTPEKESSKGSSIFTLKSNAANQKPTSTSDTDTTAAVETKENPESTSGHKGPSNPQELPNKPLNIAPLSPSHQSPHSPLAFRGSPEKPQALPPIDVGYGGP
jgi:hypothetical protein